MWCLGFVSLCQSAKDNRNSWGFCFDSYVLFHFIQVHSYHHTVSIIHQSIQFILYKKGMPLRGRWSRNSTFLRGPLYWTSLNFSTMKPDEEVIDLASLPSPGPHSASPDTPSWQSWPPQGRPRPRPPRGASGGGGHLPLLRPFLPLVLIYLLCSPSLPSFLPFSPSVFLFGDLRLFSYRPLALSLVSLAAVSNAREIGSKMAQNLKTSNKFAAISENY